MRAGLQFRGRRSNFVGPSAPEHSNHRVLLQYAREGKPPRIFEKLQQGISAAVQHHLSIQETSRSCLYKSTVLNMDTRLSREDAVRLYNQTVCSIKASSGTPYDCTQANIDAFHGFARTLRSPTFLPAVESIQTLTAFLAQQQPTPDICNALARLRLAAWDPSWGPDVIIKEFRDIDQSLLQLSLTWQRQSTLVQKQQ